MSRIASVNKSYDSAPLKTPDFKEFTSTSSYNERATSQPILMDEYGQTPDHYYLAKKPPPSFYQVKRKLEWQSNESLPNVQNSPRAYRTRQKKKVTYHKKLQVKKSAIEKPRYDTSLGQLTKKFLKLLSDAADGIINLNTACALLSVPKRRLYDITNVLEGAGLVQKTSRNNIQWMGRVATSRSNVIKIDLEKELDILEAKENRLDELIYYMRAEIESFQESEAKYHYVTTEDLKSIEDFSEKMLIGVKTSPSAQVVESTVKTAVFVSKSSDLEAYLMYDDTPLKNILNEKTELKENSYQIKIDYNALINTSKKSESSKETADLKTIVIPSECPPVLDYNQICSGTMWTEGDTVIKNAFITEEDDIAPMGKHFLLQTEDQDLDLYPFSMLESAVENYSFSLDDGEGLTDLFDCGFSCP